MDFFDLLNRNNVTGFEILLLMLHQTGICAEEDEELISFLFDRTLKIRPNGVSFGCFLNLSQRVIFKVA